MCVIQLHKLRLLYTHFQERDAYRERDNRNHRDGFRDRDRERDRDRDSFPPHRGPGGGGRSGHRDNGRMRH